MIFRVTGKAVNFVHDESIDLAFVLPTELYRPQKLSPLGGFGRGSFFAEDFDNFNAFILTIGAAKIILVFQGCAFNLFITRYSYINDAFHIFVF